MQLKYNSFASLPVYLQNTKAYRALVSPRSAAVNPFETVELCRCRNGMYATRVEENTSKERNNDTFLQTHCFSNTIHIITELE